ncbi:substrate-binding domain-containing protein [Bifidobacterium sp. ESL0769]|uniref:substrate-binding domain-containing protein n=1 Tax=Bifidobacterium sp. ESL0769 TaxID=2983229 RepID=UPI0023F6EBDA|nr:substrate-binding domain-containing protein [Bifidobacterium sp. ESL0769]WEV68460.1 substrate-binding domain-containing protein [Bifidobacterium sp. ESL0769]
MEERGCAPQVFPIDWDEPYETKIKDLAAALDQGADLDGLFVADNMTALLAKAMCTHRHLDIDIVGYDGSDTVRRFVPDLPTVAQPIAGMARKAVDVLIREIDGDFSVSGAHYKLPVSFLPERSIESLRG